MRLWSLLLGTLLAGAGCVRYEPSRSIEKQLALIQDAVAALKCCSTQPSPMAVPVRVTCEVRGEIAVVVKPELPDGGLRLPIHPHIEDATMNLKIAAGGQNESGRSRKEDTDYQPATPPRRQEQIERKPDEKLLKQLARDDPRGFLLLLVKVLPRWPDIVKAQCAQVRSLCKSTAQIPACERMRTTCPESSN
jgi:hypothetical protein